MTGKKYLRFGNKLAYGSGAFGNSFCFTFVSSFVLIYLTDSIGLNSAIVGLLMMISKIFDGVSDVLFGRLIDRAHFKGGKARPWFMMALVPLALFTFLEFAIPAWSEGLQYAYFFIVYSLLNAVFYTILDISYAAMTSFVTKNDNERVQLGAFRFIFALLSSLAISIATTMLVSAFGGGTAGWRMTALVYAVVMLVTCGITVFGVKELPESELYSEGKEKTEDNESFWKTLLFLFTNKYFLLILGIYIASQAMNSIAQAVGIYYVTYLFNNPDLYGLFSMAGMFPMIIGLFLTPLFTKKYSMYKTNVVSLIAAIVLGIPYIIVGQFKLLVPMMILLAVRGIFTSPITGTLNALIAASSHNVYLKTGKKMEGSMFACSSMGMKVGSGIGVAIAGFLLNISGYDGLAAVQSDGALRMISFMYLVLPVIALALQLLFMTGLNVEKENSWLERELAASGSVQ